jgi:uncharacterized membrane protein HdeD (DUF308 family)
MNTMLQGAQQQVHSQLTKLRWALGLNGALAVAFAVAIIVWPNMSLYALVIVFGAYALARGIVGIYAALTNSGLPGRGWLVLASVSGIATGIIVFLWTDMSALALLYVIGAYAIVFGIIIVGGAFWLPFDGSDTLLLSLTGLVSILFGVVMFANPGDGALVLLSLIAAYALVLGIFELAVAIGGERLLRRNVDRAVRHAEPQATS